MRIFRNLPLVFVTLAAPVTAQVVYVQPATPTADELAAEMRRLGTNPSDVNAMIRAGELTLQLDDPTAASGFFARAERIDPRNPRIKAGKGSILVQEGRPNEALRQFFEAEALRGDVRGFAADRGLAYDLIGEQERAQRDYRLALKDGPADETLRRYALSLGISGQRDEALAQIDQLLRRSDRGAWRTRAFILAMTGDARGAERIATSMMPAGMAQGLQPFFDRLPRLGPIDRAFAVHFGEVRPTPQRLADARLKPVLPALAPELRTAAPVVLASATPVASKSIAARDDRRSRRERKRGKQDAINLAATPPPVPLPQPPAYQGPAQGAPAASTPSYVQPLPSVALAANRSVPYAGSIAPSTVPAAEPRIAADRAATLLADRRVQLSAVPVPAQTQPTRATSIPSSVVTVAAPPVAMASTRPPAETDTRVIAGAPTRAPSETPFRATPATPQASAVVTPTPVVVEPRPEPAPVQVATLVALAPATTVTTGKPAPTGTQDVAPSPAVSPSAAPSSTAPSSTTPIVPAAATLPPTPGPVRGEDSILAKIIANITVPGSELDVEPVESEPTQVAEADVRELAPIVAARASAPDPQQARALAEQKAADKAANDKQVAAKALADKKLADKKLADKKAAEAKKLVDAKKAADELKRKNDPKVLEPSRIWVQVAGGANESDLPKEWARVKAKAPAAFKGKTGWTTPLRATNRVLAGPFKTDAEARAFVNALTKEGLSGFSFTSDAGQKISRLGGK